MSSVSPPRNEFCIYGIITVLAWIAIWAAGFPAPHVDDLFFTGTGISLAQGQGLHNPCIEPWLSHFGSNFFYAQPPLHPHALGVWLRLFGVGTSSILAFQDHVGAIACFASFRLLRQIACPIWMAALGWLLAAAFILNAGLRPDAWGAALAMLAALAWWRDGSWWWAAGCVAAALAVAFHPFALTVVIPAGGLALFDRARQNGPRTMTANCLIAVAAIAVVLGLLAFLLDFAVTEFWTAFRQHARERTPPSGARLAEFWHQLTLGRELFIKLPAALTFVGMLIVGWRCGDRRVTVAAAVLVLGTLSLGLLLYAGYTPVWLWPLMGGLTLAIWANLPPFRRRSGLSVALALVVVWNYLPWGVGVAIGRRDPPARYGALRAELAGLAPSRLLLDESAARDVFDFRLPPSARDWLLSRRTDIGMLSSLRAKPPNEIWLVDERKLQLYVPDSGVRAECAGLAGRPCASWLLHPGRVRLVR